MSMKAGRLFVALLAIWCANGARAGLDGSVPGESGFCERVEPDRFHRRSHRHSLCARAAGFCNTTGVITAVTMTA
jgi:hypothetical protein